MEEMRLNKFLSAAGVCSRREADRLIAAGAVTVDGATADMGMKVTEQNVVICQGNRVELREEPILLAVNKPEGVVCTTAESEPNNIVRYVGYPQRVYPVGRLDKSSSGLILMTNQGELMDQILRASNYHEKEYLVTINKAVTKEFLEAMRSGVPILDTVTRPCQVEKLSYNRFRIVLTQGLNRQIRRMCEALDCRVVNLKRVRIMNIRLGNLKTGTWRRVQGEEWETLKEMLQKESRKPAKKR